MTGNNTTEGNDRHLLHVLNKSTLFYSFFSLSLEDNSVWEVIVRYWTDLYSCNFGGWFMFWSSPGSLLTIAIKKQSGGGRGQTLKRKEKIPKIGDLEINAYCGVWVNLCVLYITYSLFIRKNIIKSANKDFILC